MKWEFVSLLIRGLLSLGRTFLLKMKALSNDHGSAFLRRYCDIYLCGETEEFWLFSHTWLMTKLMKHDWLVKCFIYSWYCTYTKRMFISVWVNTIILEHPEFRGIGVTLQTSALPTSINFLMYTKSSSPFISQQNRCCCNEHQQK